MSFALKRKGDVSVAAVVLADGAWEEVNRIRALAADLTAQLAARIAEHQGSGPQQACVEQA